MECSNCQRCSPNFICGGCNIAVYCDAACQRLDWYQSHAAYCGNKLVGIPLSGTIRKNGSKWEIVLDNVDQDKLFLEAKQYVNEKKLFWAIQKPVAWTQYGSTPYITLNPAGNYVAGEKVNNIKLTKIYHFTSPNNTKWVAYAAQLPPKYSCGQYECLMSIGQDVSYSGTVKKSGSYLEIALDGVNENELFAKAVSYVKEKKLGWNVRKPHAWTDYGSSPHVTLNPKSTVVAAHVGKKVYGIKLGKIYHFTSPSSRWIAMEVKLPDPLQCEYECHMSIAQERIQ